jgi:hypothetical protein
MHIQIDQPMHLITCKKILQYVTRIGPALTKILKSNPQGIVRSQFS